MYCKQFESDLKPGWIADEVSMKACKIIRSFSQEIYAKFQANFVVLGDTKIIVVFDNLRSSMVNVRAKSVVKRKITQL